MTDIATQRAEILIHQRRFAEAEKVLKEVLATDPHDVRTLALLAEAYIQQDKFEGAEKLINSAIALSPDNGVLFFIKARIAINTDQLDQAEECLQQALALDPTDADFYALLASVKLSRKQYEAALELSSQALEHEPENLLGLNIRSKALIKLNKHEEAFTTIEGALREDPDNAYTHANYGWSLLEKGEHKKALEHFREALKQDPTMEYAQAGMQEALKAQNFVYRWFLKYAFWIGNLTAKYQWFVIIGFYVLFRIIGAVSSHNPQLEPVLFPILIGMAVIAFSTWVITPISNLFLRLSPYGRFLLDRKEILSSNFVGISVAIFFVGLAAYIITGADEYLAITVFGFVMMPPLSVMFSPTKYKNSLVIYAAAMALVGLFAIAATFNTGEIFNPMSTIFLIGFVAFQWIANFLLIKQSNR